MALAAMLAAAAIGCGSLPTQAGNTGSGAVGAAAAGWPSRDAQIATTTPAAPSADPAPKPIASASGLSRRLIVGYQGWFGCPGDFEGNRGWQHWFAGNAGMQAFTVDMLPVLDGIDDADRCDTGLSRADGSPIQLFSSQNPRVVDAHFRWMKAHGIDGVALQRFVTELSTPAKRRRQDQVLANARAAAQAHGRVLYVTYDVSGADPATVIDSVRADWRHLVDDLRVTASPAYLHDGGKPVLQLWGFGFRDRPGEPAQVVELIHDLKRGRAGLAPATLIGGVPAHWRLLARDARPETGWAAVYRAYDVLSPWTVGRFADPSAANRYLAEVVQPDLALTRGRGQRYLPVVFPGFSWHNLMSRRGQPASAQLNRIPRQCGRFLWQQVTGLLAENIDTLFVAMFDEVDEATAIFPVEPLAERLPAGAPMVHLAADGCALPSDWYLRLVGRAARYLRSGERPPPQPEVAISRP